MGVRRVPGERDQRPQLERIDRLERLVSALLALRQDHPTPRRLAAELDVDLAQRDEVEKAELRRHSRELQDLPAPDRLPGQVCTTAELDDSAGRAVLFELERVVDAAGQRLTLLRTLGGRWTAMVDTEILGEDRDLEEAARLALRTLELRSFVTG